MARPLRIDVPRAIYHAMSRGNGRQPIFRDDTDRRNLREYSEDSLVRYGWDLFAFVLTPNHFHLFLRTPRPNLARGMQCLFSSHANCLGRREIGHLAQSAAAWLCRRLTIRSLRELSLRIGLSRPESVGNLIRRFERPLAGDPKMKRDLAQKEAQGARKTNNKV